MAQSNTDAAVDSARSSDSARRNAEEVARAEQLQSEQEPTSERDEAHVRRAARASDAADSGKGLLAGADSDQLWQRWWQIQASFVDAPRSAVAEAHALVGGIVDGLVLQLEGQRAELEQRWSSGQEISTEELRCDLQRYRDFLGQLLSRWDAKSA